MERWYLACHKAGRNNAFKAQMYLNGLNVVSFIPQVYGRRQRKDRPGQLKGTIELLFPGYMFVSFDPEVTHISKIYNCPGMSHLVRFAGEIFPIRDAVVEEIMKLPVCSYSPGMVDGKSEGRRNKGGDSLSMEQRELIGRIIEMNDGANRSALFYAFVEAASKQSG
ncbi:transcription termination/antitermination NusG family protein [Burkholderia ubonensis]|uniref:transcription termination/antitermination NusG family protein n=1 Tax=Burkholderia ubonensis TaxID=101571 RepID=UPI0008FE1D39|nr:transcription termination/antitermination NusG family protein [Burkholderia ubonensis]